MPHLPQPKPGQASPGRATDAGFWVEVSVAPTEEIDLDGKIPD